MNMRTILNNYPVKDLRTLLTHINMEKKISGIRLMKKEEIINLVEQYYNKPKFVNGSYEFKPKTINISTKSLLEVVKKDKKIKEKVIKEVVKDVVKETKKRGGKTTNKVVVEIKKEVKKVVEKKKPAPNKKAKEHIEKVVKEVVKKDNKLTKKKKLTKKELEFKKEIEEDNKKTKKRMEGEELLEKNKSLLIDTPTKLKYSGASKNKYDYLFHMLNGMSSIRDYTEVIKEIKKEILKIKKDKLKKIVKK